MSHDKSRYGILAGKIWIGVAVAITLSALAVIGLNNSRYTEAEATRTRLPEYRCDPEASNLWVYSGTEAEPELLIFGWLGVIAALCTLGLVLPLRKPPVEALWTAFVLWTVLPPFWFCYEYLYVFKAVVAVKHLPPEASEVYFHGLELSEKMWLAMVAVVSARLYNDVKVSPMKEASANAKG
jgi:hypothetical protein